MLDSGIDPVVMPCPQDFLLLDLIRSEMILFGFSIGPSDYSKKVYNTYHWPFYFENKCADISTDPNSFINLNRGGTCQISPWDHIYLAVFWMYNSLSVVLFHYFWKMQSDVWGIYNIPNQKIMHISGGDFSVNSRSINGWLRNLLWSQAAQVIQSYGTSISNSKYPNRPWTLAQDFQIC